VHRKKDATDWGVQPQISVPLDQNAETKAFIDMNERDRFLRPVKVTTQPTTNVASATSPTTQPQLDAQLQRAVDTMIALAVLEEGRTGGKNYEVPSMPDAAPATAPATAPAE
jgi:hypothetical protein